MRLRPSLQRIALSLAVASLCTVVEITSAGAQRASSKAPAPKSAPTGSETDRVLDGAAKALEAGNADAAMTALDGVLASGGLSNTHMARALYLRGIAHRKKGRPAQAIADLTSAVWLKDGLNEKDRAAALNARSEVSRDVGVAAGPAAGDAGASGPRPASAASPSVTPEAVPRTRSASAPRSMADDLSEAGFAQSFKPAAPASEVAPVEPAARAPATAPAAGPATSSWLSTTTVDAKERQPPAEMRQRVSAAPTEPEVRPSAKPPAEEPTSGGGLGSFFTGLFTGAPSATPAPSGDASGKSQWRPRTEQWTTTEKPAASKAANNTVPIATSAVPSGNFRLQIATVASRKEADDLSARLRKEHASAIGRRQLQIDETVFGGKSFYRVRLGPYADTKEPKALCDQLRPKGYDCLVVTN